MSALDAANAHPLAAAKLAEWGVEVEEDLLSLEPADIGELTVQPHAEDSFAQVRGVDGEGASSCGVRIARCVSFFPQQC